MFHRDAEGILEFFAARKNLLACGRFVELCEVAMREAVRADGVASGYPLAYLNLVHKGFRDVPVFRVPLVCVADQSRHQELYRVIFVPGEDLERVAENIAATVVECDHELPATVVIGLRDLLEGRRGKTGLPQSGKLRVKLLRPHIKKGIVRCRRCRRDGVPGKNGNPAFEKLPLGMTEEYLRSKAIQHSRNLRV